MSDVPLLKKGQYGVLKFIKNGERNLFETTWFKHSDVVGVIKEYTEWLLSQERKYGQRPTYKAHKKFVELFGEVKQKVKN